MTDTDPPSDGADNARGAVNDTVEFRSQFRELTRLEINNKWYRISDYSYSRFHGSLIKADEAVLHRDVNGNGNQTDQVWTNNGSISDSTNTGW